MDQSELDAIKARCAAATEGPWEHHKRTARKGEAPIESTVSSVGHPNSPKRPYAVCVNPRYGKVVFDDIDAAFIAHARTDISALAEECEKWRQYGQSMLAEHADCDPLEPCVCWVCSEARALLAEVDE